MKDLSSHEIVALVRNREGQFLLLEDVREEMKGHWAPPHGHCQESDAYEEDGVMRQVWEETGLSVIPLRKVHAQPAGTKAETVSFWLATTHDQDVIINEDSSGFGWFTPHEALRLLLSPGTKRFFENVRRGEINLD